MSHNTSSTEELAVASALLHFGSTGSSNEITGGERGGRPGAIFPHPPIQGRDASTTRDTDSKFNVMVTVGSNNSSPYDTLSEKEGEMKKRSSTADLPVLAPAVSSEQSSTNSKYLPVEGVSIPATVKGYSNEKEEYIIQDCHAVLGDRHCAGRTTIATVILREIKLEYKDKYKGKGVDNWYDDAMIEYDQRVKEKVPGFTQDDYETILVYSYTPQGKKRKSPADAEISSNRVEKANCYKYHSDDFPKYGKAKVPEAVKFFFNSKDAPTLSREISKYSSDFKKLKSGNYRQPPPMKMQVFEDFLKFCEDNLQKAKDEEMAEQLLRSLNLIPTLRRLWEALKTASASSSNSS